MPTISYAQRFEDLHLLRCFGERADGFYIDVGAGHPVVDSVSFAFYLRGWRGVAIEPNPNLARLGRAVRPRDETLAALLGAAAGEAQFYLVEEFHGFSTTIAAHAQRALADHGKTARALTVPVLTLQEVCARYAPDGIDFLKIDVEGAEKDVLAGGDWERYRPRIVLVEALEPFTLAPAWENWEPLLCAAGYRYAFFDGLNRYYVAEEAAELAECFSGAPAAFADAIQFGALPPALETPTHPDRPLAEFMARAALTRLPLLSRDVAADLLTVGLSEAALAAPAGEPELRAAWMRVFGEPPTPEQAAALALPRGARLCDVYAGIANSEWFRIACGRVAAGYEW